MTAYQQDTLHTLLTLTWSCQRHVGPFLYWCTDWLNFIINRLLQLRQIISMDVLLPYVHTHQKLLCFPSVVKQQINKIYNKALPWRCWLGGRWVSSFLTAHQHIIGHFSAMGGRKGIRRVKNWVVGYWRGYLSGARCRLAYGPADATATHCLSLQ